LPGFVTENFPIYLDSNDSYSVSLWQSTLLTTDAEDAGASFDASTGAIVFAVDDGSGLTASATCRRSAGIGWPPTVTGAVASVPVVAKELTRVHSACF
jgi:hypothetical protein